jgi:hypothetical protein
LQTHDTTFSEKILDFYKILEESNQFFILFFKENGKSEAVFPQVFKDRMNSLAPLFQECSFFFKLSPHTSKMLKNPQVLEDRTLSGAPQCRSYNKFFWAGPSPGLFKLFEPKSGQ